MTSVETIRRVLNTLVSDGGTCTDEVRDAFAALYQLEAENKNLTNAIAQLRWAASFEKE